MKSALVLCLVALVSVLVVSVSAQQDESTPQLAAGAEESADVDPSLTGDTSSEPEPKPQNEGEEQKKTEHEGETHGSTAEPEPETESSAVAPSEDEQDAGMTSDDNDDDDDDDDDDVVEEGKVGDGEMEEEYDEGEVVDEEEVEVIRVQSPEAPKADQQGGHGGDDSGSPSMMASVPAMIGGLLVALRLHL